ncbi:MAG: LuxR C-terminal-related transcriptional regulator [Dehalococcoidia bacterium]
MTARRTAPLTVLIVDAGDLAAEGLRTLLERDGRFRVAGVGADEPIMAAKELQPDLIVTDRATAGGFDFPLVDSLRAASRRSQVAVLTATFALRDVLAVLQRGVRAYLLKKAGDSGAYLCDSLYETGAYGARVIDPIIAAHFEAQPPGMLELHDAEPEAMFLSARDRELLQLLADGFSEAEIAARLGLHAGSVQSLIKRLCRRFGCRNRPHLVATALRRRLVA